MRHYEIVFLVHPDQSEQVPGMVERYRTLVENSGGTVHRQEDWGRRQLAYTINKIHKAHYIMMNIECDGSIREELEGIFKYNDAIIRSMVIKRNRAISDGSPLLEEEDDSKPRSAPAPTPAAPTPAAATPAAAPTPASNEAESPKDDSEKTGETTDNANDKEETV